MLPTNVANKGRDASPRRPHASLGERALPRVASLALGIILLAAIWMGPLPELARQSFSAHMAMHMGVVAVAAPLIALGLAGGRFDPARRAPAFFAAIPASALELVVVWVWHAPALHHLARSSTLGLIAEQASFILAGLYLWISAYGGGDVRRGRRRGIGALALLLTAMHMALLGVLLALSPRPLYAHAGEFFALSPLEDQHLGGVIMLVIGGISYIFGGLWLVAKLLRGHGRTQRDPSAVAASQPSLGMRGPRSEVKAEVKT